MEYARLVWFFALMGAFAAAYQTGAMTGLSEEDAAAVMAEFEDLVEGIDANGIFLHNMMIAASMFIPGAGVVIGLFSAWMTGIVFSAIDASAAGLGDVQLPPPLFILFLTPFGLLEVCSYSIAMSRSLLIIITVVRRGAVSAHLRPLLVEVGIVAALLLAGGYVEFFMIENAVGLDTLSTPAAGAPEG